MGTGTDETCPGSLMCFINEEISCECQSRLEMFSVESGPTSIGPSLSSAPSSIPRRQRLRLVLRRSQRRENRKLTNIPPPLQLQQTLTQQKHLATQTNECHLWTSKIHLYITK